MNAAKISGLILDFLSWEISVFAFVPVPQLQLFYLPASPSQLIPFKIKYMYVCNLVRIILYT